jgi:hypothetical protein
LFGAGEVRSDLEPLPFLHVVRDHLSDHAVGELVVVDLDRQVVEEVRIPETMEVVEHRLLGRVVVGHPDALGRLAGLELNVIKVGGRLDDGLVPLGLPAGRDQIHDRSRSRGRLRERGS